MPREGVPTPTLVCALVSSSDAEIPHVEYLQCEDPLTWTKERKAAQVFPEELEALRVAQEHRAPLFFTYTARAQKPADVAKTIPARYRRCNEVHELPGRADWRAGVPNAGVE